MRDAQSLPVKVIVPPAAAAPKAQSSLAPTVAAAPAPTPPAPHLALPPISSKASIDVQSLIGKPIVFNKTLKAVPGKSVFLVDINSQSFVVKAGTTYTEAQQIKNFAADQRYPMDELALLGDHISNYLVRYPGSDTTGKLYDALVTLRAARFARALQANTATLRSRPGNAPRVWGDIFSESNLNKGPVKDGLNQVLQNFEAAFAGVTGVRVAAAAARVGP